MSLYLSLAWRNIWRNKRRSWISIASVLFAVIIALGTRSMQLGFYSHSINNVVSFFTGYMQVHTEGFNEKQSLDKSFILSDSLLAEMKETRYVTLTAPRLETFALISAGQITDGALIIGIDPKQENKFTKLKDKLTAGRYLNENDDGIVLAEGMAQHLKLGVGDTVVVLGQGYHGIMAAGKYSIVGIVKFPIPDLNTRMAYITLPNAQQLTGAYDRVTSLAVMIDKAKHMEAIAESLRNTLSDEFEVVTWKEMMPELDQTIEWDSAGGVIMLWLIYIVVGFGILGTVLMMTMERVREFGVLMAVGMKRFFLSRLIFIESVILSLFGAIAGMVLGIPFLLYMREHPIILTGEYAEMVIGYGFEPIMPFILELSIFTSQTLAVLIIAIFATIIPIWRVSRLNPVDAMRTGG